MEKNPRTTTTESEENKRLVINLGGFSVGSGGGIVVAGVIFMGGIIVTAATAFSFLSRRRRDDSSGNNDVGHSSTAIVLALEDDGEEEDLKKDFGINFEKDMHQNLMRFDMIISSPVRLNHFGEIEETKLVTCIFRNGLSSEEGFFRPPDKKGRLEVSCKNDDEEFPLLISNNIVQNSFDSDQEIKVFTIALPNSGNIKEIPFQAAAENQDQYICHDGDEYFTSIEVVEKNEEHDQDGDVAGARTVSSEVTETEEKLDLILKDQIGQENGSKLNDCEESQDAGNHDHMLHENDQDQHHSATKPDLILGSPNGSDDEEEEEEQEILKMQQAMHLGKFNNDWLLEKGLQNVINVGDKSSLNSSLIERYTWRLTDQSERTTNSHRRSVLVFTVLVLSGSLRVWFSSRPLLNLLLLHFRNYIMVKLHLMYRNHGRNHLKFRLVPKMIGI